MIPTEQELVARFGVSRITIRKAIDDLVNEGSLIRRQGRGTFTSSPKLTHELNSITSWTEQLRALGYKPRTEHRTCNELAPPRRVANMLGLKPDENVFMLRRVRLGGDEPLALMTNYIPARLVPDIDKVCENVESLYELLESHYHLVPAQSVDVVETRPATEEEAAKLLIEPWSPLLVVTRVSYLENESPLEFAVAISRGDRFQYQVTLKGRSRSTPARYLDHLSLKNGDGR